MTQANLERSRPQQTECLLKLEQFLPHRLNVLSSLVSQALTRVYAPHGITIPEWRALVTLGEYGEMTGKAIGAHSHMHKTKVSRAVALLEKRKLLTRRANRADLREAFLSLTPAGRARTAALFARAIDERPRVFAGLEERELAALADALNRIDANVRALLGTP
jgi:DNA-binding MarR family transcriptional regulator